LSQIRHNLGNNQKGSIQNDGLSVVIHLYHRNRISFRFNEFTRASFYVLWSDFSIHVRKCRSFIDPEEKKDSSVFGKIEASKTKDKIELTASSIFFIYSYMTLILFLELILLFNLPSWIGNLSSTAILSTFW